MGLVRRLVLPVGVFLIGSIGAILSKLPDINRDNLLETYKTPAVERVLEIEEDFASLDDNREYFANGPGKYMYFLLEYSDSLKNPQTRENIGKICEQDKEMNDIFYTGIAIACIGLGWGTFRIGRYRGQKKFSQKA